MIIVDGLEQAKCAAKHLDYYFFPPGFPKDTVDIVQPLSNTDLTKLNAQFRVPYPPSNNPVFA